MYSKRDQFYLENAKGKRWGDSGYRQVKRDMDRGRERNTEKYGEADRRIEVEVLSLNVLLLLSPNLVTSV